MGPAILDVTRRSATGSCGAARRRVRRALPRRNTRTRPMSPRGPASLEGAIGALRAGRDRKRPAAEGIAAGRFRFCGCHVDRPVAATPDIPQTGPDESLKMGIFWFPNQAEGAAEDRPGPSPAPGRMAGAPDRATLATGPRTGCLSSTPRLPSQPKRERTPEKRKRAGFQAERAVPDVCRSRL